MRMYRKVFANMWMIFILILLLYFIIFASTKERYSESENRMLNGLPTLTVKTVLSGDFENGIEDFLLDQFIARDKVIAFNNKVRDLLSIATYEDSLAITKDAVDPLDTDKVEIDEAKALEELNKNTIKHKEQANLDDFPYTVGCYMEVDGRTQTLNEWGRDSALAMTAVLNRYAALLPEGGRVIFTMVPQSYRGNLYINSANKERFYSTYDEIINAFGSDNVYAVDTPEVLDSAIKAGEYVYFRSDMHWTPYGSYLVYKEMMNIVGKEPLDIKKDFNKQIEEPFLGTIYRDAPSDYLRNNADTLEIYTPKVDFEFRRITGKDQYEVVDFINQNARSNDRYTVYLGGPSSYAYTYADNKEKDNAMVIMDSFGLGFFPFLVNNYKEVHYYDPRYFNKGTVGYSVAEMIKNNNIKDIYVVVGDLHSFDSGFILSTASYQLEDQT